jgi:hypothetical protein
MRFLYALGISFAAAFGARAQSCVMCYTSASQQTAHARHALSAGILILLIPTLSCLAALVVRTVIAARE